MSGERLQDHWSSGIFNVWDYFFKELSKFLTLIPVHIVCHVGTDAAHVRYPG